MVSPVQTLLTACTGYKGGTQENGKVSCYVFAALLPVTALASYVAFLSKNFSVAQHDKDALKPEVLCIARSFVALWCLIPSWSPISLQPLRE